MRQLENIDINDLKSFDVKDYVIKIISNWKLFIIVFILGLLITSFINSYKQRIYSLESIIAVKEEQNPLFTSTTNIAFNWGGPSDKVENIITILKSRTHNEKVVDSLQSYITYMQEGRFRLDDITGQVPFKILLDSTNYQLLNIPIKLEYLENEKVLVEVEFENEENTFIDYSSKLTNRKIVDTKSYSKKFNINEYIYTPYSGFNINIDSTYTPVDLVGKIYYVVFRSYNGTVNSLKNINAISLTKGTSLIQLELKGTNKKKIEDYLNATVKILERDQKAQKIEYATKTRNYINSIFLKAGDSLMKFENLNIYIKETS